MKAFSFFFCKGQDSFGGKNIHKLKALIDTFSSIAWIQSLHLLKFENIELYQMKYVHTTFLNGIFLEECAWTSCYVVVGPT
jgi:hypothetical protein